MRGQPGKEAEAAVRRGNEGVSVEGTWAATLFFLFLSSVLHARGEFFASGRGFRAVALVVLQSMARHPLWGNIAIDVGPRRLGSGIFQMGPCGLAALSCASTSTVRGRGGDGYPQGVAGGRRKHGSSARAPPLHPRPSIIIVALGWRYPGLRGGCTCQQRSDRQGARPEQEPCSLPACLPEPRPLCKAELPGLRGERAAERQWD